MSATLLHCPSVMESIIAEEISCGNFGESLKKTAKIEKLDRIHKIECHLVSTLQL